MIELYHSLSQQCSRATTAAYSTSFCSAIRLLHPDLRTPVFNIYGFVRFADEIVDSFHDYDKAALLEEFEAETWAAIERGISLNPILHSFQRTVKEYNISFDLISAFFHSMEMDLTQAKYDQQQYREYIYGSAEVVGLMCLQVFTGADGAAYEKLKPFARSLGAAFQKVNFLRDVKSDLELLNRVYFPGVDFNNFTPEMKSRIEAEIAHDFAQAYQGIIQLPSGARLGVYVAYKYYLSLFRKIKKTDPLRILQERIRIADHSKLFIVAKASLRMQLNIL